MDSYHVLELAGEGSFGRVHKGRKKHTGQVVALKFIPKVGRSEKELRNLKREIEIMRGLQHPNIVQLFDSFETENEVVVVTEYAEGQLFQILEDDGRFAESLVRDIACQLVSALYYLHSHRILHRDMKPQNILIGKSGVVKLCDFGFARAMSVSTLVLTSIKGTPLYMAPELVEERPYDHTADLWSLGCILYELHTGAPPFYTNSIFHLVQLIIKDQVKWPETMSQSCTSFLKGLLTKDPLKRLSWPDLLQHPFVADGVLVLPDTGVFSPLTVPPSPDMLAKKLRLVAEKRSSPSSGGSRLLQKVREQMDNVDKKNPRDGAKKIDRPESERSKTTPARTSSEPKNPSVHVSPPSTQAANQSLNSQNGASTRSKLSGQISRDYQQEFPSVEVGPRLSLRNMESPTPQLGQDADDEEYWKSLAEESDPSREPNEPLYPNVIISQLKSKILEFKAQLTTGGSVKDVQILQPLKVLRNLILAADPEELDHIGLKLVLPRLLFDLILHAVENCHLFKERWFVATLGELISVLLVYLERNSDWVKEEQRLEALTKPFNVILTRPELRPLALLAASVLSLFLNNDVDVMVDVEDLSSILKAVATDSYEPPIPLPVGWGLCDGLFCLLLHMFSEHTKSYAASHSNPVMSLDLWKRIHSSLLTKRPDFCSADGLYYLLHTLLHVLLRDPFSCVPLFTRTGSECVATLGCLLGTHCLHIFAEGSPGRLEEDLTHSILSELSCHLLCFPFALDLHSNNLSAVLQSYHAAAVVPALLQAVQTLPLPRLELPLTLLSRLLMCDPRRSVSRLRETATGFFSPQPHAPPARAAGPLLSDLLRLDECRDSAVELLTFLSQAARCFPPFSSGLRAQIEAPLLLRILKHPSDQVRAATCRLLVYFDPLRPSIPHTERLFSGLVDRLHDAYLPARRAACWAVGNWLGHVAATFKTDNGNYLAMSKEQKGDDEGRRWREEAKRAVGPLASLMSNADDLTRRHCCGALANLGNIDGALSLLTEEEVPGLLLKAACTDSNASVRKAAVTTLSLYSQQETLQQVLISLDAKKKLLLASQWEPPPCDFQKLIEQLEKAEL